MSSREINSLDAYTGLDEPDDDEGGLVSNLVSDNSLSSAVRKISAHAKEDLKGRIVYTENASDDRVSFSRIIL